MPNELALRHTHLNQFKFISVCSAVCFSRTVRRKCAHFEPETQHFSETFQRRQDFSIEKIVSDRRTHRTKRMLLVATALVCLLHSAHSHVHPDPGWCHLRAPFWIWVIGKGCRRAFVHPGVIAIACSAYVHARRSPPPISTHNTTVSQSNNHISCNY